MKQKKVSKKSLKNFWEAVVIVVVALVFVLPGSAMFINDNTFDNTLVNISPASWSVDHKTTSPFDTRDTEWNVALDFNESSGKMDQVVFGEAPDANDGPPHDNYDQPKPPAPMPPYIRGWFDDGLPVPYDYLLKDYRHYPDIDKMWDLYVRWESSSSNLTNVTISWNINNLNDSEYNSVVLMRFDPFDDEWDFAANMLTEEEFVYSPRYFASDWLIDHFQIIAAVNTTLPQITNVTFIASNPLDTEIGWENFTCTVTDNTAVDDVKLILTGDTTTEYPMTKNGDTYSCNITINC